MDRSRPDEAAALPLQQHDEGRGVPRPDVFRALAGDERAGFPYGRRDDLPAAPREGRLGAAAAGHVIGRAFFQLLGFLHGRPAVLGRLRDTDTCCCSETRTPAATPAAEREKRDGAGSVTHIFN